MYTTRSFARLRTFPLLAALIGLCMLSSCSQTEFKPNSAIPATAISLIRLDVRTLLDRGQEQWTEMALEGLETNDTYLKIRDEIGLNVLEDIDRILIGIGPDAEVGQAVAIFEGRFEKEQVLEGLKLQEGYVTETIEAITIHYLSAGTGDRLGFFFPADDTLIAVGEAWAGAVVDTMTGTRATIETNEELQSLLDNLDTSDPVWVVGMIPSEGIPAVPNPLFGPLVSDLRAYMFSGDLDQNSGLHLLAMVRTGQPGTAANLTSMANLGVSAGRASIATSYPSLSELLGLVELNTEGNMARLEIRCESALLEAAVAELEKLQDQVPYGMGRTPAPVDEEEENEDVFAGDPFFDDEEIEEDSPAEDE